MADVMTREELDAMELTGELDELRSLAKRRESVYVRIDGREHWINLQRIATLMAQLLATARAGIKDRERIARIEAECDEIALRHYTLRRVGGSWEIIDGHHATVAVRPDLGTAVDAAARRSGTDAGGRDA